MATAIATEERTANVPALTPEGERFNLAQRQARMFAMSPLVPDHLRKGPAEQAIANCWIALTLAEAMDEMPLIVMQNIHIINGKAGFASKYMIARANASGKFKDDIDWEVRGSGKDLSVTCFASLTKSGKRVEMTVDMAMAEAEGWTRNAKYKSMPEVMLRYRSASFLVNMYAPEVMLGYKTAEEIEDVIAAAVPVNEPLTGKMLIDQARTTENAPEETAEEAIEEHIEAIEERIVETTEHDPETGEIKETTEKEPEQEPSLTEDFGLEQTHAAQVKADQIIGEIKDANAIVDVNSIGSRYRDDIRAMPEAIREAVENAAKARKSEIEADRAKAKQGELAK